MKKEKSKRQRGTGSIYNQPRSPFLWIAYYRNGKIYRESTHTDNRRIAEKMLQTRLAQIHTGTFTELKTEKVKVSELAEDYLREYRIKKFRSLRDAKRIWNKHLEPFFGHLHAVNVTTDLVRQYTDRRLDEGAKNATINRELAALKRMFNLAKKECTPPKVKDVPYISMLEEDNTRTEFMEPDEYQKLAAVCAKEGLWLRTMFELGYVYGWRLGEVMSLRVKQVNLLQRNVRLLPGTTKNKQGRTVKMTEKLYVLLQACIAGKKPTDHVFTRPDGSPVKSFYGTWRKCCKEAGMPGFIFHSLRRTAVRNMVDAGVPEKRAMEISGHVTRSVFDRYNVGSQRDSDASVDQIEQFQKVTTEKVHTYNMHTEPSVGQVPFDKSLN